jgi:hypothetical protein
MMRATHSQELFKRLCENKNSEMIPPPAPVVPGRHNDMHMNQVAQLLGDFVRETTGEHWLEAAADA